MSGFLSPLLLAVGMLLLSVAQPMAAEQGQPGIVKVYKSPG